MLDTICFSRILDLLMVGHRFSKDRHLLLAYHRPRYNPSQKCPTASVGWQDSTHLVYWAEEPISVALQFIMSSTRAARLPECVEHARQTP